MFDSYPFTDADAQSDRWRRLQVWLALQLPSDMTFALTKRDTPGIGEEEVVVFTRSGYADDEVNAGLLLRGPSIALTQLQVHFHFGDPTQPVFFDYVRQIPPPAIKPTPLPPQPEGIGGETMPGSGVYFALPGDTRPNGALMIMNGKTYRKTVQLTPFGPRMFYREA